MTTFSVPLPREKKGRVLLGVVTRQWLRGVFRENLIKFGINSFVSFLTAGLRYDFVFRVFGGAW